MRRPRPAVLAVAPSLLAAGVVAAVGLLAPMAAAAAGAAGVAPAPSPTGALAERAAPADALLLTGKGFGHGVGLSQDGALALGREGKTLQQLLAAFYPGTSYGLTSGPVRVAVAAAGQHATVRLRLPAGGAARSGGSGILVPAGGTVELRHEGDGYRVALVGARPVAAGHADRTHAQSDTPYDVTSDEPVQVVSTGRAYGGTLRVVADGAALRVVDALDIEEYLRGLGEVRDPSWPLQSLQAQVVAARSYAAHQRTARNPVFDLYDDDRSQVYLGTAGSYPLLERAVTSTQGSVLTYRGQIISAVYSSSGGGVSATPEEGFGARSALTSQPYLRSAAYPTADPQPWEKRVDLTTAAQELSYPGRLQALSVRERGPSGRVLLVQLSGSAGTRDLPGVDVEKRLALRSTLFAVAGDAADASALAPLSLAPAAPDAPGAGPIAPAPLLAPPPDAGATVASGASGPGVALPGGAAVGGAAPAADLLARADPPLLPSLHRAAARASDPGALTDPRATVLTAAVGLAVMTGGGVALTALRRRRRVGRTA